LEDINAFQIDPNHPQYRGHYKGGLHDYDLSNPHRITDEYLDKIADAEERAKKKETRMHTFEGMGVMQDSVAMLSLKSWLQSQALGLLGYTPASVNDPVDGQPKQVFYMDLKDVGFPAGWGKVGEGDTAINLKIPVIKRNIQGFGESIIPVLNPGRLVPRIYDFSQEQKDKLKARRTRKSNPEQIGSIGDVLKNYDLLTPEQKDHLMINQRDLLHHITGVRMHHDDPWSVFNKPTPHGKGKSSYGASASGFYTVGGFNPNKSQDPIAHIPKDEIRVFRKYFKTLHQEAEVSVMSYIEKLWRKKDDSAIPPEVTRMLDEAQTDMAGVAAIQMTLKLNGTKYGVNDPEVDLTIQKPGITIDDDTYKQRRINWYYDFVRNTSQMSLTADVASRRHRGKVGKEISANAPMGTSSDGGKTTDLQADISTGMTMGGEDKGIEAPQRRVWMPRQSATGGEMGPSHAVARAHWIVPVTNEFIKDFYTATRNELVGRIGADNEYVNFLDRAKKRMEAQLAIVVDLVSKEKATLRSQGETDEDKIDHAAGVAVSEKLPELLKNDEFLKSRGVDPGLFKGMTEKEAKQISRQLGKVGIRQAGDEKEVQTGSQEEEDFYSYIKRYAIEQKDMPPEVKSIGDKKMDEFLGLLFGPEGKGVAPSYNPSLGTFVNGPPYKLIDILEELQKKGLGESGNLATNLVSILKLLGGNEGASKHAVQFLMSFAEFAGKPMSHEQAIKAVEEAGVKPVGATKPETPPIKMPHAEPTSVAAADITGMLGNLPANLTTIMKRSADFLSPQHRPSLEAAYQKLTATLQHKFSTDVAPTDEEMKAWEEIGTLLGKA
jgi:hypothetical protein